MFNGENQPVAHKSKKNSLLLGFNMKCLGYSKDHLKSSFDTFERKPDFLASTEIWLTEDKDRENYNVKDFQPIETNPKKNTKQRSGGVAFYIETGIEYKLLKYVANNDCSFNKVEYHEKEMKVFSDL